MDKPSGSFREFFCPSKRTVVLILVVVVITIVLSALVSILLQRTTNLRVPSLGFIRTIGVEAYWDADLTDKIDEREQIDWGTLWVGSSSNITVYLRSISNINTTLTLTMANLTFTSKNQVNVEPPQSISTYMNLTWNYDGSIVDTGDVIPVTLTLCAHYVPDFISYLIEKDVQSFSLDIVIQATMHNA